MLKKTGLHVLEERVSKLEKSSLKRKHNIELEDEHADDDDSFHGKETEPAFSASTSFNKNCHLATTVTINDISSCIRAKVSPYLSSGAIVGEKMPPIQLAFFKYWVDSQEDEITGMFNVYINHKPSEFVTSLNLS